jgi:hypothetical protein
MISDAHRDVADRELAATLHALAAPMLRQRVEPYIDRERRAINFPALRERSPCPRPRRYAPGVQIADGHAARRCRRPCGRSSQAGMTRRTGVTRG